MSFCLMRQVLYFLPSPELVTNSSAEYGGVHLPDLTVITPVFDGTEKLIFWAASRGHHADVSLKIQFPNWT